MAHLAHAHYSLLCPGVSPVQVLSVWSAHRCLADCPVVAHRLITDRNFGSSNLTLERTLASDLPVDNVGASLL